LISRYLQARLPMLASWQIETMTLLLTALVLVLAGTILSFIFFGKNKRLMLYFSMALALLHGAIGWYSYGRLAVDESAMCAFASSKARTASSKSLNTISTRRPEDRRVGRRKTTS